MRESTEPAAKRRGSACPIFTNKEFNDILGGSRGHGLQWQKRGKETWQLSFQGRLLLLIRLATWQRFKAHKTVIDRRHVQTRLDNWSNRGSCWCTTSLAKIRIKRFRLDRDKTYTTGPLSRGRETWRGKEKKPEEKKLYVGDMLTSTKLVMLLFNRHNKGTIVAV